MNEWLTPLLSVGAALLTALGGVIVAFKKFGTERTNTIYDQVQEDLKDLRAEFAAYRKHNDEELDFLRAINRHLENENTEMRNAWPSEVALPPRKPYPVRSEVR